MSDQKAEISAIVDELIEDPPESSGEFAHRIRDVDAGALRAEVLDRAEAGELRGDSLELVVSVFSTVGIGDEEDRLRQMLTDDELTSQVRRVALLCLAADEHFDLIDYVEELGPERMEEFLAVNVASLLAFAEEEPEVALELGDQILTAPPQDRFEMFVMIDEQRRQLGMEAGMVYAGIFTDPDYEELWPLFAGAIVDDGMPGDAEWLDEMAKRAEDEVVSKELRRGALRLRTRGIEEPVEQEGFGLVGSCDGSGGFAIFLARQREEGALDVVNLLFRVPGEYRDSFSAEMGDRAELDEIIEGVVEGGNTDFVEIPLSQAAALARLWIERATAIDPYLPGEFEQARRRVSRIHADPDSIPSPSAAAEAPNTEETYELLDDWIYDYWFVEVGALIEAEVDAPEEEEPSEEWMEVAIGKLAKLEGFVERTASLADHMALWHCLNEDLELAGKFAAMAELTRSRPAESPLIEVLLDRAVAIHHEEADGDDHSPVALAEDPLRRRAMRQRFFSEVDEPMGQDVVRLALATATHCVLEASMPAVSHTHQPRPEEEYELSFKVAEEMSQRFQEGTDEDPEALFESLVEFLRSESKFDEMEATFVTVNILNELQKYMENLAPEEFFFALDNPGEPMAEAFFK